MLSIPEDVSSEVFKGVKARHGTRQLHGAIIPGVFPPISPMRVSHFLGL